MADCPLGLFAREGATVFAAARHAEPGAALVRDIEAAGGKAYFIQLDTTDQAGWDAALADIKAKAGALHVLLNTIGTNDLTVIPHISMDQWNKVFEVNVNGTLMGIQTCAQLMKDSGGGSIVNIGSVAVSRGRSPLRIAHRSGRSRGYRALRPTRSPTGGSAAM